MTESVVSDAGVEAAMDAWWCSPGWDRELADSMRRALTAALPHLLGDFGLAMRYSDEIDRLGALVAERDAEIARLREVIDNKDKVNRTVLAAPREALVTLADCPIGLFLFGDELCMKTEYGSNEGRIDAYIVSSGEFFWGSPPQTIARQRGQLVTPVDAQELLAASRSLPAAAALLREAGWMVEEPKCETCKGLGVVGGSDDTSTWVGTCPTCNGTGGREEMK